MSENLFASKTKADLMEIVRMTGVLPIGKAQKMRKYELVEFLSSQLSEENSKDGVAQRSEDNYQEKAESVVLVDENQYRENKISKNGSNSKSRKGNVSQKATNSTDSNNSNAQPDEADPNNLKQIELKDDKSSEKKDSKPRKSKVGRKNSKKYDEIFEDQDQIHLNSDENSNDFEKKSDNQNSELDKQVNNEEITDISGSNFIAKVRPRKNSKTSLDKSSKKNDDLTSVEVTDLDEDVSDSNDKNKRSNDLPLVNGVLEIMPDGYGFLRTENYIQGPKDVYVQAQMIKRFSLRSGDFILGNVKDKHDKDQFGALVYIHEVNGRAPETMHNRANFERLTPVYPQDKFVLETERHELSTRIIDLFSPIGKGQRGMIVSPPKAGKTILLQKIANAISKNNPKTKLFVLLIDERPEEVTDMQRRIDGEVVYSTFDKSPENHIKISELVLERAKRLVELGEDVVILVDSLTRMARAYNLTITPTGRTLTGGLDPAALHHPKRFFGAARNIENGGSLTILATALVETGSRMDEVIFEEFKGTGNMEVYLDRKLSEKRIFPAIDINRSSTRREELLLSNSELEAVWAVRKAFSTLDTSSVTELIISLMLKTKTNQHMIDSLNISLKDKNVINAMKLNSDNNSSNGNGNSYSNGNFNESTNTYYDY